MTGGTESLGSDSIVQPGLLQVSQEVTVSVRMCSVESKQLSRRLEDGVERN